MQKWEAEKGGRGGGQWDLANGFLGNFLKQKIRASSRSGPSEKDTTEFGIIGTGTSTNLKVTKKGGKMYGGDQRRNF